MKIYYDFKGFRTTAHLRSAMITHCSAVKTRIGFRGRCPHPECHYRHYHTLRTSHGARVAYCSACRRSFDALEITKLARNCSHMDACFELATVIVSG